MKNKIIVVIMVLLIVLSFICSCNKENESQLAEIKELYLEIDREINGKTFFTKEDTIEIFLNNIIEEKDINIENIKEYQGVYKIKYLYPNTVCIFKSCEQAHKAYLDALDNIGRYYYQFSTVFIRVNNLVFSLFFIASKQDELIYKSNILLFELLNIDISNIEPHTIVYKKYKIEKNANKISYNEIINKIQQSDYLKYRYEEPYYQRVDVPLLSFAFGINPIHFHTEAPYYVNLVYNTDYIVFDKDYDKYILVIPLEEPIMNIEKFCEDYLDKNFGFFMIYDDDYMILSSNEKGIELFKKIVE